MLRARYRLLIHFLCQHQFLFFYASPIPLGISEFLCLQLQHLGEASLFHNVDILGEFLLLMVLWTFAHRKDTTIRYTLLLSSYQA